MTKNILLIIVILIAAGLITSAIIKLSNRTNTNTTLTPAEFTMTNTQKVFDLQVVNGSFNHSSITYQTSETVEIRLRKDDQPVDFRLQEVPSVQSKDGVMLTNQSPLNQVGTYHLVCVNQGCGVMVVNITAGQNNSS